MSLTYLIIGHQGFVGSHLAAHLMSVGERVYCIGRSNLSVVRFPDQIDVIVNCAAELTDESRMFESNVALTHRVLELARELGARKVIHIGSSSEYGVTNEVRREDTLCVPSNIYEATKLAATALCQGYASRYDLDIVVARPFSLYGPRDKARKLIPTLYRSFVSHQAISVHPGSHDWLYVDDFVAGVVAVAQAPREMTKGQVFNFGTGVSSSNREIVEALEAAFGGKLNVTYADTRYHTHDVDNWVADATKARTQLNWQPKHDLRSGMQAYVLAEWFATDQG